MIYRVYCGNPVTESDECLSLETDDEHEALVKLDELWSHMREAHIVNERGEIVAETESWRD